MEDKNLLDEMINKGYGLLNLQHYFTVGKDEVRSWTIKQGSSAPRAAGLIHSDFEKSFVAAVSFLNLYSKFNERK